MSMFLILVGALVVMMICSCLQIARGDMSEKQAFIYMAWLFIIVGIVGACEQSIN